MKKLFAVCLFSLFSVMVAQAADTAPDKLAQDVTDKILNLIKTNRDAYNKDHKKLYGMVNEQIVPYFEFRKIAQQVLGPAWRTATEDQRTRFMDEFRGLLVRTYATALLKYNDQKIVYQPAKIVEGDRTTVVKSQIVRTGGAPPVGINYYFLRTDSGWKVYDMAIEGPTIVTTYKNIYTERLQKGGLDALIDSIAQENKRAETGTPAQ